MIQYYYPKTIKNVTVALMDMFNDLKIVKYDSSGTSAAEYTVPLTFGPVEKEHLNRIEDHEYIASATDVNGYKQVEPYGQRYWVSNPRLALVMNGVAYNAERAYGVNEWREWFAETVAAEGSNIDDIFRDYAPAPYDINYTLYIMTDSMDYYAQILENILPYFNPALFLRVKEFSFLNIERDLRVTMPGVTSEFVSPEMSDDDRRLVNGTMDLTVEAWQYRPFERSALIKVIKSQYFVVDSSSPAVSALSAQEMTSAYGGLIISADTYTTSGVEFTSAGDLPTSAIPASGTYTFSGTYEDDKKDFAYFTSAQGWT